MRKQPTLAISYDFDGTLAPGNMQERDFIPAIGMTKNEFWAEVTALCKEQEGDNILIYMGLMLQKAQAAQLPVRKKDFEQYGSTLSFFEGIDPSPNNLDPGWFPRINLYAKESGVKIEHYIISSGLREMIKGSKIGKYFKEVYASSFWYNHHGVAHWPALAINYTTKTQYLFRINKGTLHIYDHDTINSFTPKSERPVPFERMLFIGDGETDIPCFRLVKDQGGHSIAVYHPGRKGAKSKSEKLLADGRVNFAAPADYRAGGRVDRLVKSIIDKIQADDHLLYLK